MLRTRDKRSLVLGAQPVIRDVEASKDFRDMLSDDPKLRGHMINLKKVLMGFVLDKVKLINSKLLQVNLVLALGGIDSVNLHFSNKNIHTPFIEFIIFKREFEKEANFEQGKIESTTVLLAEINKILYSLASDETCTVTREILRECDCGEGYKGNYFESRDESALHGRMTIDFFHNITKNVMSQPFIEIRILPNLQMYTLEKYGIPYLPLGFLHSDISAGLSNKGGADWKFRDSTLKQSVERSGLTFSSWTFNGLLRYCFPAITMKKMKVEEGVRSLLDQCLRSAPIHSSGKVKELEVILLKELSNWQNNNILLEVLTLENLYERCVTLGLLPNGRDLKENLFNEYNKTHIREARTIHKTK